MRKRQWSGPRDGHVNMLTHLHTQKQNIVPNWTSHDCICFVNIWFHCLYSFFDHSARWSFKLLAVQRLQWGVHSDVPRRGERHTVNMRVTSLLIGNNRERKVLERHLLKSKPSPQRELPAKFDIGPNKPFLAVVQSGQNSWTKSGSLRVH